MENLLLSAGSTWSSRAARPLKSRCTATASSRNDANVWPPQWNVSFLSDAYRSGRRAQPDASGTSSRPMPSPRVLVRCAASNVAPSSDFSSSFPPAEPSDAESPSTRLSCKRMCDGQLSA
eukprot:365431-Chlamydomonas_euryale.AAC.17